MKNRKNVVAVSILLTILFIAAQFVFSRTINGGLCAPYLDAPAELRHPALQLTDYGFPFPFVTAAIDMCFDGPTIYNWSPLGVGIDILVLALIAYPFWRHFLKNTK